MNILLIDDSRHTRTIIGDILREAGYRDLLMASSAMEAFDVLGISGQGESGPAVDLILMDIVMPAMDGVEACRRIKQVESLREVPIIIVSMRTDDESLKKAFDAGVCDYITKPINRIELLARVRSALGLKTEMDRRKENERHLRNAMERLRSFETAVGNMQLGLTFTDMDGKIVYTNPAEAEMHGYYLEEMLGQPVKMLAPPQLWKQADIKHLKEARSYRRESINIKRDGSTFPVHLMSSVVENNEKEPVAIVTTCEDITERRRTEEELERYRHNLEEVVKERTANLKKTNEQLMKLITKYEATREELKRLSGRILSAHEDERKRLALELHDGIGQSLLAIKLNLQMNEANVKKGDKIGIGSFENLISEVSTCIEELRNVAMSLRPSFLEDSDIDDIIRAHCRKLQDSTAIKIVIDAEKIVNVGQKVKDNLYRIYQEAMSNVAKHSGAGEIRVTLRRKGKRLRLEVIDNGKGFSPADGSAIGGGIGLSAMRERAELLGGSFRIRSAPGSGTTVSVEVKAK